MRPSVYKVCLGIVTAISSDHPSNMAEPTSASRIVVSQNDSYRIEHLLATAFVKQPAVW